MSSPAENNGSAVAGAAAGTAASTAAGAAAGAAAVPAKRSAPGRKSGKEARSESSSNEIWREVIRKEDRAMRGKQQVYSCNLLALQKDQISEAPGTCAERRRVLTEEDDAIASRILSDYGIKTAVLDPSIIRVPVTSASTIGAHLHFQFEDNQRVPNAKQGCAETKYAENFYSMQGVSAFAAKQS